MRFSLLLLWGMACAPPDPVQSTDVERPGPVSEPPPAAYHEQEFAYARPQLDLVFLIDAPIFVGELLATVDVFVKNLRIRDIDYHLGVANIDWAPQESGALEEVEGLRWVDRDHPMPGDWLRSAMSQVWSRSADESATLTAHEVLRRSASGDVNWGFLRPGAEVAFVLFSDNYDISDKHGVSQEAFLSRLFAHQPDVEKLGFHFIRFLWGNPCCGLHDFELIREQVPGLQWDAQVVPYFPLLVSIAQTVERANLFVLEMVPEEDTIEVTLLQPDGDLVEVPRSHLFYDPATLTVDLDTVFPDHGATVIIRYIPAKG